MLAAHLEVQHYEEQEQMSLEGGCRVVMVYDCERKEYAVESARLWGI